MAIVQIPIEVFEVRLQNKLIGVPVQVNLRKDAIALEVFVPDRMLQIELDVAEEKVRLVIRNYIGEDDNPQVIDLYSFFEEERRLRGLAVAGPGAVS